MAKDAPAVLDQVLARHRPEHVAVHGAVMSVGRSAPVKVAPGRSLNSLPGRAPWEAAEISIFAHRCQIALFYRGRVGFKRQTVCHRYSGSSASPTLTEQSEIPGHRAMAKSCVHLDPKAGDLDRCRHGSLAASHRSASAEPPAGDHHRSHGKREYDVEHLGRAVASIRGHAENPLDEIHVYPLPGMNAQ